MPKYLDGVQDIDAPIQGFEVLSSGTIAVANQYPITPTIPTPARIYKNYGLLLKNETGQTINSFQVYVVTNNLAGEVNALVMIFNGTTAGTVSNTAFGSLDLTPTKMLNPFIGGSGVRIQASLSAAGTGSIKYSFVGWN